MLLHVKRPNSLVRKVWYLQDKVCVMAPLPPDKMRAGATSSLRTQKQSLMVGSLGGKRKKPSLDDFSVRRLWEGNRELMASGKGRMAPLGTSVSYGLRPRVTSWLHSTTTFDPYTSVSLPFKSTFNFRIVSDLPKKLQEYQEFPRPESLLSTVLGRVCHH